jgi:hypothetical protein
MFELKPIHHESVPAALEKARHYRLLNEPMQAESICLDILTIEPKHQEALVLLVLALSDQLERDLGRCYPEARAILPRLSDAYERLYYDGVLCERRAKAHFRRGVPGSGHVASEWFRQAMDLYEQAEAIRPSDNDDVLLRWNTCARIIDRHRDLEPEPAAPRPYLE